MGGVVTLFGWEGNCMYLQTKVMAAYCRVDGLLAVLLSTGSSGGKNDI